MELDRCTLIQRAGFHYSPCVINIFQSLLATLPVLLPRGRVLPRRGCGQAGPCALTAASRVLPWGTSLITGSTSSSQHRRGGRARPLCTLEHSLSTDSWPRGAASFASHRRAVGCSVPCRFSELFGPRSTACLSKPALEKTAVGTKCVWFQPKTARKEQAARHHGERFSRPPGGATGSEPTTPHLPRTPAPARPRVSPPRCHRHTDAHRTPTLRPAPRCPRC